MSQADNRDNTIANVIRIIAYSSFAGWFIIGIILGRDLYGDFAFGNALLYWLIGLVAGIILLGFAEIISLLQQINNNTFDLSRMRPATSSHDAPISASVNKAVESATAYEKAVQLFGYEQYDEALKLFEMLTPYGDSSTYIKRINYLQADALMKAGDPNSALLKYVAAGDYEDAQQKVKELQKDSNATITANTVIVSVEDGMIVCPTCGAKQKEHRSSCFKCGTVFVKK